MLAGLFDILICPFCRGSRLKLHGIVLKDDEIKTGEIICENCRRKYPIIEGIPCLLSKEQLKIQEGTVWREWRDAMEGAGKDTIDDDQRTYKDACRIVTGGGGMEEAADRLMWEKKLYEDNQILRKELGSKFESKWAVAADNIRLRNDNVFRLIEEAGGHFEGKRALNVGPGIDDDFLQRLGSLGVELINCDIILDPLLKLGNDNGGSVCSDLKFLPFDRETFDAVFCFHVIHHIDPIEEGLSEAVRVLGKKGKIFILELNYHHLVSLLGGTIPRPIKKFLRRAIRKYTGTEERLFKPSPYEKVVRSRELVEAMQKTGLVEIERKTVTHAPMVFPGYIIRLWNRLGFRLPLIFDPVALEYFFIGRK